MLQLYNSSPLTSVSDEEINEIVSAIDLNANGSIDFSEFLVAAMRKYNLQNDEFLHSIFDVSSFTHTTNSS